MSDAADDQGEEAVATESASAGERDSEPEAGSASAEDEEEQGPLVFVDGSAEDLDLAEGLKDELSRGVWTFEPGEFGPDMLDEICDASAIVVAWNLGGLCGLDVLEMLRQDARTRDFKVLLASEAPTEGMVRAAIRSGAHSFVTKPYETKEILSRLRG